MTLRNTSSMVVSFKNNNEQLRPRVLPTGDPDVYQVVWSSDYTTTRPVMKWAWIPEGPRNRIGALGSYGQGA